MKLPNCKILEIGIGRGRFGILLGKKFRYYYGIEPNKELLKIARKNKEENVIYKWGKAENIPFNKKFDIVFYALSWHFIKDFDKVLSEALRVIKRKGIIIILEPTEKTKYWKDSRLNKSSKNFDENVFNKKIIKLKKGQKIILNQKIFTILENEYESKSGLRCYLLKND